MPERRLQVLIPMYEPVGGIMKVFDYVRHARALGYLVRVWCHEEFDPDLPLFRNPELAEVVADAGVTFQTDMRLHFADGDLILMSLPREYEFAFRSVPSGWSPERIIHLIQNVRHVNVDWRKGEATRVLTRPAARISINTVVADTIEPWLDRRCVHTVINLGHNTEAFRYDRSGGVGNGERAIRVAYTTWKSHVGELVAHTLTDDPRFEFRAIRQPATWDELGDLYRWADVFLSTPLAEEGMYLPGLEAMAAGALVVTPDAGGNMAYCRPGDNCLLVDFGEQKSYVEALERIASMSDSEIETMRRSAYATTREFDLDSERAGFAAFLDDLWARIGAYEAEHAAAPGAESHDVVIDSDVEPDDAPPSTEVDSDPA